MPSLEIAFEVFDAFRAILPCTVLQLSPSLGDGFPACLRLNAHGLDLFFTELHGVSSHKHHPRTDSGGMVLIGFTAYDGWSKAGKKVKRLTP